MEGFLGTKTWMFVGRFGRVFVVLLGSDGLMVSSLRTGPGQLRSFRFTERDERARSIDPTFSQQLVAPVNMAASCSGS